MSTIEGTCETVLNRSENNQKKQMKTQISEQTMETNLNSKNNNNNIENNYDCSILSSETDLSFSMAIDRELEAINGSIDSDELPAFEIRLVSPMGCTPSPINYEHDMESFYMDTRNEVSPCSSLSPCEDNSEFVTLRDIDAQISPPSEYGTPLSRDCSLETIYEDVFLNTPPRQHSRLRRQSLMNNSRSPRNLLEKMAVNRLQAAGGGNKENQSPLCQDVFYSPLAQESRKECNEDLKLP